MGQEQFSRRSLLSAAGAAAIVPASPMLLDVARPTPAIPEVHAELAFVGTIQVGPQLRNAASPNRYSAAILGGEASGPMLQGQVQPGRIEWIIDATSNTVEITAHYAVLRADGTLVQVRDRSVHPAATAPAGNAGFRTTPELSVEGGHPELPASMLVGVLDASEFSAGTVKLRAFRVV